MADQAPSWEADAQLPSPSYVRLVPHVLHVVLVAWVPWRLRSVGSPVTIESVSVTRLAMTPTDSVLWGAAGLPPLHVGHLLRRGARPR